MEYYSGAVNIVESLQVWSTDASQVFLQRLGDTLGEAWLDNLHLAASAQWHAFVLWWQVCSPILVAMGRYLYANPDVTMALSIILLLVMLGRHVRNARYLQRAANAVKAVRIRMRARYETIMMRLTARSRRLAAVTPHLVFLFVAALVFSQSPAAAVYMSSNKALFTFGVLVPTISTASALVTAPDETLSLASGLCL
eukprot:UC1_evm1s301